MMIHISRKILTLFTLTAIFLSAIPQTGFTAPLDIHLMKIDFASPEYIPEVALVGQPSSGTKWQAQNGANTNSTVELPEAPYDNVESGNVAKMIHTGGGQVLYNFGAIDTNVSIKARAYFTQGVNIVFGVYFGTNPITQFFCSNGVLRYSSGASIGTGDSTEFPNRYTIPAEGAWVNFEIKAIRDEDDTRYDRCEYYFSIGDTPPVKLATSTADTLRNRFVSANAFGMQVQSGTSTTNPPIPMYLDYVDIYQNNILLNIPTPAKPTWNEGVLNWESIADAESYKIKLFRAGKLAITLPNSEETPITSTSYDLKNIMNELGFGTYNASIIAIAKPKWDKDSLESDQSNAYIYTNPHPQLATPEKPVWNGNVSEWQNIPDAASYTLDLYKGSVRVKTVSVLSGETSFDFASEMLSKGKGMYKLRLKAVANPKINNDSEISEFSEYINFDPESSIVAPTDENYCILAANVVTEKTLSAQNNNEITSNLTLPSSGLNTVSISWYSDSPNVIGISGDNVDGYTGVVNRPVRGKDTLVTLTATFSKNGYQWNKMYKFIVKSLDPEYGNETNQQNIVYRNYASAYGDENNIFQDVLSSHWAKNYIEFLYSKGILSGTAEGIFEPDRTITKEEVCKMLVNLLGLTGADVDKNFVDVMPENWFYNSVLAAYSANIANGISETEFGSGTNITRQDLVTMIVRTVNFADIDLSPLNDRVIFSDEGDIADYAKESIAALQMAGILSGNDDGTVSPLRTATRAETAKLICSIYVMVK